MNQTIILNSARLTAMLLINRQYWQAIKKENSKEAIKDRDNNIKKAMQAAGKGRKLSFYT
jgi:hypothetical protein